MSWLGAKQLTCECAWQCVIDSDTPSLTVQIQFDHVHTSGASTWHAVELWKQRFECQSSMPSSVVLRGYLDSRNKRTVRHRPLFYVPRAQNNITTHDWDRRTGLTQLGALLNLKRRKRWGRFNMQIDSCKIRQARVLRPYLPCIARVICELL